MRYYGLHFIHFSHIFKLWCLTFYGKQLPIYSCNLNKTSLVEKQAKEEKKRKFPCFHHSKMFVLQICSRNALNSPHCLQALNPPERNGETFK